jgi:hypothetical protein
MWNGCELMASDNSVIGPIICQITNYTSFEHPEFQRYPVDFYYQWLMEKLWARWLYIKNKKLMWKKHILNHIQIFIIKSMIIKPFRFNIAHNFSINHLILSCVCKQIFIELIVTVTKEVTSLLRLDF